MNGTSTTSLNAICPYYTMYPLSFPLGILERRAENGDWVLDPFCGRGTTNFAARVLGLPTIGQDSSPVAVAIAAAKLAETTVARILRTAGDILSCQQDVELPSGRFWQLAYHPRTLSELCRLRSALLQDCRSDTRIVLRAVILGALHGPRTKEQPSYFSNQSPRSFAPKPNYAVRFWKKHGLRPPRVDVLDVIRRRAERYLAAIPGRVDGYIALGDSRSIELPEGIRPRWIVTSPPYYGTRTYIPDQWLRNWLLGGPAHVQYGRRPEELSHTGSDEFITGLRTVWDRLAQFGHDNAHLVVRFGSIADRKVDAREILRTSLAGTGWRLITIRRAGNAGDGRRQASQFGSRVKEHPRDEYDFYARLV